MKNIVVIAHDSKKTELVSFFKEREEWLFGKQLIATGKTADAVESEIKKMPIEHLSRGRYGGYNEITGKLKNNEIDLVVFFKDHEVKEHHIDIQLLLDTCNINNVPLATNTATANLLIIGWIKKESIEKLKLKNA